MHFAKPLPEPSSAGVRMFYTPSREIAGITEFAGVVPGLAASKLVIPPRPPKTTIPITCAYTGDEPLHVFAYRVPAPAMATTVFWSTCVPQLVQADQTVHRRHLR